MTYLMMRLEWKVFRQEFVKHMFNKLMEILTAQQKELLDDFTTATSEKDANAERIIYQHGMKDLYALIMALA